MWKTYSSLRRRSPAPPRSRAHRSVARRVRQQTPSRPLAPLRPRVTKKARGFFSTHGLHLPSASTRSCGRPFLRRNALDGDCCENRVSWIAKRCINELLNIKKNPGQVRKKIRKKYEAGAYVFKCLLFFDVKGNVTPTKS